jgi:hypothetical protein
MFVSSCPPHGLWITHVFLQVSTLVSVAKSQQMFEAARVKDQKDLETRLMEIQRDQKELAKVLGRAFLQYLCQARC